MNIICKLGFHSWDKCKCRKCGITRDTQHVWLGCKCLHCDKIRDKHDWKYNCEECITCHITRTNVHQRNGCKCIKCYTTFHIVNDSCICTLCGEEVHDLNLKSCICERCGKTVHLLDKSCLCLRCKKKLHQYAKVGTSEEWDRDWDRFRTVTKYKCQVCGDTYES
jgi:hypothetical protein